MTTSEGIRRYARELLIDLVGIAPIERFDGVPPQRNPLSIFPEAKSVVMLGRAITRGTIRGIEEGTNWDLYRVYGYETMNELYVPVVVYHFIRYLEDEGWEAIPISPVPIPPEAEPSGVPVCTDRPAPNVVPCFNYAAVAAGLGEIGYCGVLLTPRFGPLQRLGMVITDAPLEPDPIFSGEICDKCMKCVEACPLEAIDRQKVDKIVVAGKEMTYAQVDWSKCNKCPNGARRNPYDPKAEPDRVAAACVRACLVHLEGVGRMGMKYYNPFRKGKAWAIKKTSDDSY